MPDDRSLLEREMERVELRPFTLDGFHRQRERKQRNQRVAAGVLGIAVFALATIGLVRLLGSGSTPASDGSTPASPFQDVWVSISDDDGGTKTMTVGVSVEGAVEIVVLDDVAKECSFTPSTMTGTGRIEGGTALVIPAPNYTCDDGSEPQVVSPGPSLQEQLRNLTFFLDPESDTLTDNSFGGLWAREAAGIPYTSPDGELTVSAPSAWTMLWPEELAEEVAPDVWFGSMWRREDRFGSGERVGLVDPVAYDSWCAENGGSPLLSAPANATAIAQQVAADPNFETTAPVTASIGGVEAVSIDVALAPGGEPCGVGRIEISRWIHELEPGFHEMERGWRLRLYLVDLPEGMSVDTLAITVVAPEERFEDVIEETAPIIDSIEFHAP